MKLSKFGEKFSSQSGIVELMDDLGTALNENPDMIFMGGGNPGRIPQVEQVFKARMETILSDPAQLHSLMGVYQSPQGDKDFREHSRAAASAVWLATVRAQYCCFKRQSVGVLCTLQPVRWNHE